jgi:hypothetical protein
MNSLTGKVSQQNTRGHVRVRAQKYLPVVRAGPSVIHGSETANGTELKFRDSFSVFGRGR